MKFHTNLPALQQAKIKTAIDRYRRGEKPIVALTYEPKSKSRRKAGVDYVELPGLPENVHIGRITSFDNGDKILIHDLARADGRDPGQTYILIEKITGFDIVCWKPAKPDRDIPAVTKPTKERHVPGSIVFKS